MVATDLSEYFGRDRVFQLAAKDERTGDFYTRARVLFDDSASHEELLAQIKAGGKITVIEAPADGKRTGNGAGGAADLPMFVDTPGKDLQVLAAGDHPTLGIGQELSAWSRAGSTDRDCRHPAAGDRDGRRPSSS